MPVTNHDLLAEYPVVVRIPVQWGEMDAYGHVNNTIFFRYFETARIAFLERCGLLQSYEHQRVGAILHSTSCRFRRALFYPDTVDVGGRTSEVGDDRFTMQYRLVSLAQNDVVADGEGVIVSYDYAAGKKVPLPDDVRRRLATLGGAMRTVTS
jgi:acyl-CoA thioester hydrolase